MPPMPCETFVRLRRPLCPSLSLHLLPLIAPRRPVVGSLATNPYRRPPPSSIPCFSVSLGAARSLGLSEARPLVFLLFPSRLLLLLLLVITTNLSRINSPSGINSSTVQAEKEKVIAGVGAGSSPSCRALTPPDSTRRSVPPTEKEKGDVGTECRS